VLAVVTDKTHGAAGPGFQGSIAARREVSVRAPHGRGCGSSGLQGNLPEMLIGQTSRRLAIEDKTVRHGPLTTLWTNRRRQLVARIDAELSQMCFHPPARGAVGNLPARASQYRRLGLRRDIWPACPRGARNRSRRID
jgi:hypothetical protein